MKPNNGTCGGEIMFYKTRQTHLEYPMKFNKIKSSPKK